MYFTGITLFQNAHVTSLRYASAEITTRIYFCEWYRGSFALSWTPDKKRNYIIQKQIGDAVAVGILLICSQKVTLELKVDDGDIKSDASVFSCIGCLFYHVYYNNVHKRDE
jgi:hypothetical protein